jgi:hypothetical protein
VEGGGDAQVYASFGNHPFIVFFLTFFFLHANKLMRMVRK